MRFPERHPELGLYWRLGWVLIFIGLGWILVGVSAARFAQPLPFGTAVGPWHLVWWASFGWAFGLFVALFGTVMLVYRALNKRKFLFGDRVRREYK